MNALREHAGIAAVLALFLLAVGVLGNPAQWWDSAVYASMGKFLYSGGASGLWEPARPVLWPLLLGPVWLLGGDMILVGRMLSTAFVAASVLLLYLLLLRHVGKTTALLFSALFAVNAALLFYSGRILADIPAMTLALAAFWLAGKKKRAAAGAALGLAALMKFTALLLLPVLLAHLWLEQRNKAAGTAAAWATVVMLPYLTANAIAYGNPLFPFSEGQQLINSVVGNETCPTGGWFLLLHVFGTTPLLALALVAVAVAVKERSKWWLIMTAAAAMPFFYHTFLVNCKDVRYAFAFLPFLFLLAARGYHLLRRQKHAAVRMGILTVVTLQLLFSLGHAVILFSGQEPEGRQEQNSMAAIGKNETLWTTTPWAAAYSDARIAEKMYYPVFTSERAEGIQANINEATTIVVTRCDIPCPRDDSACPAKKEALLDGIASTYRLVHNSSGACPVEVWRK